MTHRTTVLITSLVLMLGLTAQTFAGGEGWLTSYDQALAQAKATGKPIMTDFTGSDWCGWCIRLNKEVFSQPAFQQWAKQNVILLELDFPQNKPQSDEIKQQNKKLMAKYGVRGFPTILFLDAQGDVLGQSGYKPGGADAWVKDAQRILAAAKQPMPEKNEEGWFVSYNKALAEAQATGKPIMTDFTGSDWCSWCIKLRHEVFSKQAFQTWAQDNVVLLELNFPKSKPQSPKLAMQNENLLRKYGVRGFPTILFLTPEGKVLGKSGYMEGGPQTWIANAQAIVDEYQPGQAPVAADDGSGFPPHVTKKLYAANDLRGKAAPEFAVEKWLTEQPKTEGKVVLVDFWATWCGPCRKLIPELNELQKTFKDDLVVIGVSDEPAQTVQAFLNAQSVEYAMAVDTQGRMKKQLGVQGIPHVMVISSDGVVRWQGFPGSQEDPLTEKTLRRIIQADKAIQTAQAKAD